MKSDELIKRRLHALQDLDERLDQGSLDVGDQCACVAGCGRSQWVADLRKSLAPCFNLAGKQRNWLVRFPGDITQCQKMPSVRRR